MTMHGNIYGSRSDDARQDPLTCRPFPLSRLAHSLTRPHPLQIATLRRAQTAADAIAGNVVYQNPWEAAAALGLDVTQFGRETLRHPRWTAQQRRSGQETFDVWPEDYLDELGKRPVFSPGSWPPSSPPSPSRACSGRRTCAPRGWCASG